jgi:hypothetical protein
MSLRTTPTPPSYDATVRPGPDARHVFNREPVLIPQLFVAATPKWYRRKLRILAIVAAVGVVSTSGVLVQRHGVRGAIVRIGRFGVAVMHKYTHIVAGRPVQSPYHH